MQNVQNTTKNKYSNQAKIYDANTVLRSDLDGVCVCSFVPNNNFADFNEQKRANQ